MRVTVRLHATLRRFLPAGASNNVVTVEVAAGATVADVVARLGIPPGHAKMIVSGDECLEPASVVRDGQELDLFPPLAGGVG
jgi:molybdopterin synthase sulfur carrier subunit